jgi:general secretion pathway protein K
MKMRPRQGMALPHECPSIARVSSWRGATPREQRRGSALLTVLWLAAALAAIAFSVSSSVRAETDRVEASSNGLRAWYLATGAVERGIQWMSWGDSFRNPDGTAKYWEYNAPRMSMTFPSGTAVVEMIPESAKLSVNRANVDDLTKVIAAVGGDAGRAREIAGAIIDWRGGSEGPSPNDQYYFGISPTFRARHASFEEIEELLFVRGMTPELFYGNFVADNEGALYASGGLRDCLSVWGSLGPFDANTVSPALMMAIGVPPGAIGAIVQRRNQRPFKDSNDLNSTGAPMGRLSVGGAYIWTLRATARLTRPDGSPSETVRIASATVKLVDRKRFNVPLHVLRWYDDAWSQSAIAPQGPSTQQP